MKKLATVGAVIAALACLGSVDAAVDAPTIPAEFGVCVTTTDAAGRSRLDGYYSAEADARARIADILANGWSHTGNEWDREDFYPAHSIVKATFDPTLINQPSCVPPPAVSTGDAAR